MSPYEPRIGVPRDTPVVFRLAPHEKERVRKARGELSTSDYLRGLIEEDCKRKGLL